MDEARSIREFWFGRLPLSAETLNRRVRFWFGGETSPQREQRAVYISEHFGALLGRAAAGEFDAWADGPRRRLSLIILLDQFPRHMFRGDARAYAYDEQALSLTLSGMQSAADAALDVVERLFFYMPMQHAESREAQDESVAAYRRLLHEAKDELREPFGAALRSAENHRAIIERFGRFPHRNRPLGRESTSGEIEWLRSGGESFGQ
jgi:uncharacterized protein (DUF924 family)